MSVQFSINGHICGINSGTTLARTLTVTAKIKLTSTANSGALVSLVTRDFRLSRLAWNGTNWTIVAHNGTDVVTNNITSGASTSEWVSVAFVHTEVAGTGNGNFIGYVRRPGLATTTASSQYLNPPGSFSDQIGRIYLGPPNDYFSYVGARFIASDVKVWSSVLTQAQIEQEWDQQAPVISTNLLCANYFDGGTTATALTSNISNVGYANSWSNVDSDAAQKTDPTYSTDVPTYATATPTLTGTDALPQLAVDSGGGGGGSGPPVVSGTGIRQFTPIAVLAAQTTSSSITFSAPPVQGSTVVAIGSVWRWGNFPTVISSVTDNWGNAYTLRQVEVGNEDNTFAFDAVAQNVQTGTPFTVTVNYTTANDNAISWLLNEIDTRSETSLDKRTSATVVSGTSTAVSSGVLSQADEVLLGVFGSIVSAGVVADPTWTTQHSASRTTGPGQTTWSPAVSIGSKRVSSTASQTFTTTHDLYSGAALISSYRIATAPVTTSRTISSNQSTVTMVGSQSTTVVATVQDNGTPAVGVMLTIASSSASVTATQLAATNANGQATISLSGVSAGSAVVTLASIDGSSTAIAVTVTAATVAGGTISEIIVSDGVALTPAQVAEIAANGAPAGYEAFKPFVTGDYTFQKALVKTSVETVGVNARLKTLTITIDVPDVADSGSVTVPAAGMTVSYSRSFNAAPDVTVTQVSSSQFGAARISAVTKTGFFVQVVNGSNVGISAVCNWAALGY